MKTEDGETLGHAAIWGRDVKCVETLASRENFNCWNVPDTDGNTPIMNAFQDRNNAISNILLKCPRVDVNLKNNKGENLLMMMALESDNTNIIKLLEECTRIDRPNKKKKKKKKKGKTSNQNNEDEKPFFTSDIKGKMSRIQDVMEANEELKSKISRKRKAKFYS